MIVNIGYGIVARMRGPGGREITEFQGQRVQHFSAERQREAPRTTVGTQSEKGGEIVEDREKRRIRVRKISTARLSHRHPTHLRGAKLNSNHAFMEPSVQVRDLKRDRVNFVLENVDLSYASISVTHDQHLAR